MVNSQRVDGKFRSDISKNYMSTIKKNKVVPVDNKKIPFGAKLAALGVAGYALGRTQAFN